MPSRKILLCGALCFLLCLGIAALSPDRQSGEPAVQPERGAEQCALPGKVDSEKLKKAE